jgi:hypothetical protein
VRDVTTYQGYPEKALTIRLFWEVFSEISEEDKKRVLRFATAIERAPIEQLKSVIARKGTTDRLTSSHT